MNILRLPLLARVERNQTVYSIPTHLTSHSSLRTQVEEPDQLSWYGLAFVFVEHPWKSFCPDAPRRPQVPKRGLEATDPHHFEGGQTQHRAVNKSVQVDHPLNRFEKINEHHERKHDGTSLQFQTRPHDCSMVFAVLPQDELDHMGYVFVFVFLCSSQILFHAKARQVI